LGVVALTLAGLPLSAQPEVVSAYEGEPMPDVLFTNWREDYPYFIAARRMLEPDGKLAAQLLPETYEEGLEGRLQPKADGGCAGFGPILPESAAAADFEQALDQADWVLTATVTGTEPGFAAGATRAGTLLRIVPDRVFKGPMDRTWTHYLFFAVGRFQFGDVEVCAGDFGQFAELPAVGDQVLLMIWLHAANTGEFLYHDGRDGLITLKRDGTVSLPKVFRDSEGELARLSASELLARVTTLTASGVKP
jgi:hypothetical protein